MDIKELELKLYEINKELPNINYGGCGTFSYHLSKVLMKKYNIKSEIYYLPGKPAAIEYDSLFSHIVVKVNDTIIDNNGTYECGSGWTLNLNRLSEEKLEEMLDIPKLWNDKFYNNENINNLVNKLYQL